MESDSDDDDDDVEEEEPEGDQDDEKMNVAESQSDAYEASVESYAMPETASSSQAQQEQQNPVDDQFTRRAEFLSLMRTRFVQGLDEFPYHTVDQNEAYDDVATADMEAEEAYFDNDDDQDHDEPLS
jgi:hypothetical protein